MMRCIYLFPPSFLHGIYMVSKCWLCIQKDFTKRMLRSAWYFCCYNVEQFVLSVLSKNSWRDTVFFQRLVCDWLPGYQRPEESTFPFWFCLSPQQFEKKRRDGGRRDGCSWLLRSLSHSVRQCCLWALLGYFFAFALRRKKYFWRSRINMLQLFKCILSF